jgi:hypothetical protein
MSKMKQSRARRASSVEVLPNGHRAYSFWKRKYFTDLEISRELNIAQSAARDFDKSTITTAVPDRYTKKAPSRQECEEIAKGFPGKIHITNPGTAIRIAYEEHTAKKRDVSHLVLWTDGSARDTADRGFAVCWRLATRTGWGEWKCAAFKVVGKTLNSGAMGMYSHVHHHCSCLTSL